MSKPTRDPAKDRRSSDAREGSGVLFLVGTPVGNLGDITVRALEVLRDVDLILAEDTRRTRKLLSRYDIHTPLQSFHEHNEDALAEGLVARLCSGQSLALVSDAGTPLISDPGFPLVRAAIQAGLEVVPVPGPSAVLAALSASGLPTDRFTFIGFLPRKRAARQQMLAGLRGEPGTLVFFESPRRLASALADAAAALGPRPAVIARELTKVHEEYLRGDLAALAAEVASRRLRGEVTVCVGGATMTTSASGVDSETLGASLEERYLRLRDEGMERNEALRTIARERNLPRREVYRAVIIEGTNQEETEPREDG